MDELSGFQVGVNLGGWLSQYRLYDHQHFQSFITADDIKQIANWGMDHIRLPIDYPILEDDAKPFEYKESGFAYIDQCLDWCQANGLGVVLDLHRAPGYSFDTLTENSLFDDPMLQQRLLALWEQLAHRYGGRKQPSIIFELLNEITLPTSDPWNRLAYRIFSSIRAIDTTHWIMVGGNQWNSVGTLKEIELYDDPRVVYTFHYYDPFPFTHQKAYWVEELQSFDQELDYPGPIPGLKEYLDKYPAYRNRLGRFLDIRMDKQFLRNDLQPAIDFLAQTGRPLYCGEFGVIESAPRQSRLHWHQDFVDLLREVKIGRACWTYKQKDFGLVGKDGRVIDQELVRIVSAG
jgi:endoglucanase